MDGSAADALNGKGITDAASAMNKANADYGGLIKQESAEQAPVMDAISKQLDAPRPAAPKLAAAPEAPKLQEQFNKSGQEFIRTSALIAGIAGAFTRQHATTALNAFGAMNKGFHQGQVEAAERSYTEWKQASEKVHADNSALLKEYELALNDRVASTQELSQKMALIATKYKDPLMYQAAVAGNVSTMAQLYEKHSEFLANYDQANKRIAQAHDDHLADLKSKLDNAGLNTPEGMQKMADTLAKLDQTDPAKAKVLREIMTITHPGLAIQQDKDAHPKVTNPRSAPAMAMQKFMEENPGATAADIQRFMAKGSAQSKSARDFATGTQGNTLRSLDVAVSHIGVLNDLIGALQNGDVKRANAAKNAFENEFGGTAPSNFDTAKIVVGNEILKVILGSGVGTGEERTQLQAKFDSAKSPEQLAGVIQTAERLMGGQLEGLRRQYERTTGGKDFDEQFLSSSSKDIVGKYSHTADGPKGGAGKFENGKIYTDANGNKAKYQDGNWVPQ